MDRSRMSPENGIGRMLTRHHHVPIPNYSKFTTIAVHKGEGSETIEGCSEKLSGPWKVMTLVGGGKGREERLEVGRLWRSEARVLGVHGCESKHWGRGAMRLVSERTE